MALSVPTERKKRSQFQLIAPAAIASARYLRAVDLPIGVWSSCLILFRALFSLCSLVPEVFFKYFRRSSVFSAFVPPNFFACPASLEAFCSRYLRLSREIGFGE